MIVVSNTSPLTNLAAIGQFSLLPTLFGQLYVPSQVVIWGKCLAGCSRNEWSGMGPGEVGQ